MKKFLIIVLALISFAFVESQSQLLTKFKAKDGLNVALEFMKTNKGMQQPKLQFLGTFSQSIPFGDLTIDIEVDVNNGTASGWAYFFVDMENKANSAGVFLVKPTFGDYFTVETPEIDLSEMGLELDENIYVGDFEWMNSNEMAAKLKADSDFSDFYNTYGPFPQIYLIIFAAINPENNDTVEPIWAISLANDDYVRNCAVQAITGEVFCAPIFSSIIENVANSLNVFPNPATDFVTISNTDNINPNDIAIVSDIYGRKVLEYKLQNGDNTLVLSGLSQGVYSIRINNKITKFIKN